MTNHAPVEERHHVAARAALRCDYCTDAWWEKSDNHASFCSAKNRGKIAQLIADTEREARREEREECAAIAESGCGDSLCPDDPGWCDQHDIAAAIRARAQKEKE